MEKSSKSREANDASHNRRIRLSFTATREIEDAIGRSRNLKAAEIWEDALAAAPQPTQQPLTDEQIYVAWNCSGLLTFATPDVQRIITRAIEAAHGIKGEAV